MRNFGNSCDKKSPHVRAGDRGRFPLLGVLPGGDRKRQRSRLEEDRCAKGIALYPLPTGEVRIARVQPARAYRCRHQPGGPPTSPSFWKGAVEPLIHGVFLCISNRASCHGQHAFLPLWWQPVGSAAFVPVIQTARSFGFPTERAKSAGPGR